MRKLASLLASCMIIAYLAMGVSATTGVTKQESFATVSGDGSCQVTTTVTLHLEQSQDKLYYPVPAAASGVTLNGSRVSASRNGDVRQINISRLTKNVVGDVTFSVHFRLHDVIAATEAGLQMQLPLLSGFSYPVENFTFSVTLPGTSEVLPGFVSGYHQARIEESLTYNVQGATIFGSSLKSMKDHETLIMTLAVTEEMFPQSIVQSQDYHWGTTAMVLCGVLAVVYWVIALWNLPVLPGKTSQPPQGYHAGQVGSLVTTQGIDLSLTVLCWAQLGYVHIQVQKNRVILFKRMEMGNERSEQEQRIFQKLFGARGRVDTGDLRYAQLLRQCAQKPAGMGSMLRRWSGKGSIFRLLASGIGLFGGASLAVAMADGAALQGLLLVVLGIAGGLSGWYMQGFGLGVLLGQRRRLRISLLVSLLWLVFGAIAGDSTTALWMVGSLLAAGLLYAWGGRRTSQGRMILSQMLGLKWYLHSMNKAKVRAMCQLEPDYFFQMFPWAMALGADKSFARAFGREKQEKCPYLATGTETPMTAERWCTVLRKTVAQMNHRADNLPVEKIFGILQGIIHS